MSGSSLCYVPMWDGTRGRLPDSDRSLAPPLTRHSGKPDNIMDQIPTGVVDPMPSTLLAHGDYPVLNRPYAVGQSGNVGQ